VTGVARFIAAYADWPLAAARALGAAGLPLAASMVTRTEVVQAPSVPLVKSSEVIGAADTTETGSTPVTNVDMANATPTVAAKTLRNM
jgi:hypothetical protein